MTRDTRLVSYKENHYEDDRLHKDRIVADPAVLGGKPVVKATQIAVDLVVEELAANPNVDELLTAHPTSPATMYRRALAYAQAVVTGEEVSPKPPEHKPTAAV